MGTAVALQPQAATDQCPWSGSGISRARFVEIQARIAEQERKKLNHERALMKEELGTALKKTEARLKEETDRKLAALTAERDRATAKTKALEARATAIRKEAERQTEIRVKAELEKKMDALATERDEAATKAKLLDAAKQKELLQQRTSLEKDRDTEVNAILEGRRS